MAQDIENLLGSFGASTDRDQILIRILQQVTASAAAIPPGGLATETTLSGVLTVLTDLFSEQRIDFELKCVEDANGDMFLLRVTWDEAAPGGYTIDYIDASGVVAVPVAPLKLCSPNELLEQIRLLLVSLDSKFNTLGQKASDDSHPVVLSTEQEAILAGIGSQEGLDNILAELILQKAILTDIEANTDATTFVHVPVISSGVGSIPVGARRGSMLNIGDANGIWGGQSIPPGIGIPFGGSGLNGTLSAAIAYDATGTTFVIEYDI